MKKKHQIQSAREMEAIHEAYGSPDTHNSFVMHELYGHQIAHKDFKYFRLKHLHFNFITVSILKYLNFLLNHCVGKDKGADICACTEQRATFSE